MVSNPEKWLGFMLELRELTKIQKSFPDFVLIHQPREKNTKADLLARTTRLRNVVFFVFGTFVPYWFPDTDNVFI